MVKKLLGFFLAPSLVFACHTALALDDKGGDANCNFNISKIPGAYPGNISNVYISIIKVRLQVKDFQAGC